MKYVNPEIEIIIVKIGDVITASGEIDNDSYSSQPNSWDKLIGLEL